MSEVLPTLIRSLREVRDQESALKKQAEAIREQLLGLLEDVGGEYVDETSGLRAYIEKTPRWDFDPTALHKLVDDHLITEVEFADALETIVKKPVVKKWIDDGLVTDRQLNRMNAKIGTKVVTTLQIQPMKDRR